MMEKYFNCFSAFLVIVPFILLYPVEAKSENINVLCEGFNGGTAFCTFVENDKETVCEAIGNGLGQCNSEDGEGKLECISVSGNLGASGLQLSCQSAKSSGFETAFD